MSILLRSVRHRSRESFCVCRLSLRSRIGDKHARECRIQQPEGTEIKSVRVNGKRWRGFDAEKGDVDVTGVKGSIEVVAKY